jgi:MoaA/NifB/PqqE/SkfB family radical SAM enzyme
MDLSVSYACQAKCLFCSQDFQWRKDDPKGMGFEKACKHVYAGYKAGYRKLAISGGDPTALPYLDKLVRFARKTGFESIRLQTNGVRLADEAYVKRLMTAGLTTVKFSIHGADAKTHDRLVAIPGAFDKCLEAIALLRKHNCRLGINIVLNTENIDKLPQFFRFFINEVGVTTYTIIYPLYSGNMVREAGNIGLSLDKVVPSVKKSLKIFEELGLELPTLLHFLPCLMPGYEERMIGWHRYNAQVVEPDESSRDLDTTVKKHKLLLDGCGPCVYRRRCPGIDGKYHERFGGAIFKAVLKKPPSKVRPPSLDPRRRVLTENERCVEAILRSGPLTTGQLLEAARKFPLCQDCRGGPAIVMAAEWLMKMGRVERRREAGRYVWNLTRGIATAREGSSRRGRKKVAATRG